MPSTVPILVQEERALPHDWQRFVAVLCFMEFYVTFVDAGTSLWGEAATLRYSPLSEAASWICMSMMCGALSLFVAGRGLWRGGRSASRWAWLGLVSVCALLALETVSINIWLSEAGVYAPQPTGGAWALCTQPVDSAYIAPLGALILGIWLTRSGSRLHDTSTCAWVYCAAAFCLAALPKWIFSGRDNMTSVGFAGWQTTGNYAYVLIALLANALLPLVTCVALLRHWRTARSFALIVATVVAVNQWYEWWPISQLVRVAIGALRLAHGFADIGNRLDEARFRVLVRRARAHHWAVAVDRDLRLEDAHVQASGRRIPVSTALLRQLPRMALPCVTPVPSHAYVFPSASRS